VSFNVVPFGSTPGPGDGPVAKPAQAGPEGESLPEVVDLARRRAELDAPEIPDHVWDEVEAASRLWRELRAQDREVRFDTDAATGRVVASLCDLEGGVVHPLPLRGTFGIHDDTPDGPSAA
jgi:hypothetical protein